MVDLRLAAPALVAWLAALVVVRVPPATAVAGACVGAAVVTSGVLRARVRDRASSGVGVAPAGRHARALRRLGPAAALALGAGVAVLVAGTAQVSARHAGALPSLSASGSVATVEGTVTGDPARLAPSWPGAPERVRTTLTVRAVAAHGRTTGAVGAVTVVGPGAWADVPHGAQVRVTGRLQGPRPGAREVALLTTTAAPVEIGRPPVWDRAADEVRDDVADLARGLPGDAGALLGGVTVGDTRAVPDDLRDAMRAAGLTHVTAVSGAHFALVVGLVVAAAAAAGLPRGARAVVGVVAMAALVVLVHPAPSVVRAGATGLVAVVGLVLGRRAHAPAALGTAVVVLLVVDPWLAGELGFLLSVLATAGLVTVGSALTERWTPRLGRGPAAALALPVAAQVVCAPAVLLVAPSVSLLAVPANVVVAPAVAPATVLGLAAGLVDPVWPAAARALALGAGAACWWIGAVARTAAAVPGARVPWAGGVVGVALLATAGLALVRVLLGSHPAPRPDPDRRTEHDGPHGAGPTGAAG